MPLRVVQWATGAVGRYSLRSLIQRPEFELVGVLAHSPDKVGRDAGELAGLPAIGLRTIGDAEAIEALGADCVVHMPLPSLHFGADPDHDVDVICRLLRSGANVVTTTGLVYPQAYGAELVKRLEEACLAGGSSVHGTGVNPGFMADVMPLTLSGMSARIDHVYALESSDFRGYASPSVVVDLVGFTKTPEDYEASIAPYRDFMRAVFAESLHLVAAGLGVELESVQMTDEYEVATETWQIAAGTIEPGTVCASRWEFTGHAYGRPFITLECVYFADASRVDRWHRPGYAVRIDGRPQMSIDVGEEWTSSGLLGTAAHAVNAIPAVCAAQPGIRTFLDLPIITGRGTVTR